VTRFAAAWLVLMPLAAGAAPADDAAALRALADDYWTAYVERYPEVATYQGVAAAPHERLTDRSPAALAAWRAREDAWSSRLREIVPRLDPATPEAVLAAALDEALAASVAVRLCRDELWAVSDTWPGWQGFLADWTAAQPVGSAAARVAVLARWRDLPRLVAQEIANLRDGMRLG
jgi:uncharacterized protein (DUF885 family)